MTKSKAKNCAKSNCNKTIKVTEKFMQCEKCKGFLHLLCSGITEAVYDAATNDLVMDRFIYCCDDCRSDARTSIESMQIVEKKFKIVDKKMEDLKTEMEERIKKIEQLDRKQIEVSSSVEEKINTIQKYSSRVSVLEKKAETFEESNEKKRRVNNLVFYNIPESKSDVAKERFVHDCSLVKKMFEDRNLTLTLKEIGNIFRLGKRKEDDDRPRPILVRFSNEDIKTNVLKYCRDLKLKINNECFAIHYSFDLTRKERLERKTLVDELKKRQSNTEEQLGIRNGKIVTILGQRSQAGELKIALENIFNT